jgi:hypothetical protein
VDAADPGHLFQVLEMPERLLNEAALSSCQFIKA